MELQKRFELGFLVSMAFILAQNVIEELRDGVCNRGYLKLGVSVSSRNHEIPTKQIHEAEYKRRTPCTNCKTVSDTGCLWDDSKSVILCQSDNFCH